MEEKDLKITPVLPGLPSLKTQVLTNMSDLATNPNTNFIINSNLGYSILADQEVKIAKNVTLIFQGGCIYSANGKLTIVGNNTAILAPISQIFCGNVEATGSWKIDRAYPQWFDDAVVKDSLDVTSPVDCSEAINKAIAMKQVGEVFLPLGNYFISNPLILSTGIQLCGEFYDGADDAATKVIPFIGSTDNFVSPLNPEYSCPIIQININETSPGKYEWKNNYPSPSGSIKNLYIGNDKDTSVNNPKYFAMTQKLCCLVGCGFTFENVKFHNFFKCICWTNDYADSRRIIHCDFSFFATNKKVVPNPSITYNIDMGRNGDGIEIRNCATDWNLYKYGHTAKALIVRNSYGGTISNNVLNMDVVLEGTTNVVFEANHLESGAQLRLIKSDVAVRNNYFEKGNRPSVVFDLKTADESSVADAGDVFNQVQMSGNTFIFYVPENLYSNHDAVEKYGRTKIEDVCQYDVALNSQLQMPHLIKMTQNYRIFRSSYSQNQPTGIRVATFSSSPESGLVDSSNFNNHSYFLSTECSILPKNKISALRHFVGIPTVSLVFMSNSQVAVPTQIFLPVGSIWPYSYQAQVFLDSPRNIA